MQKTESRGTGNGNGRKFDPFPVIAGLRVVLQPFAAKDKELAFDLGVAFRETHTDAGTHEGRCAVLTVLNEHAVLIAMAEFEALQKGGLPVEKAAEQMKTVSETPLKLGDRAKAAQAVLYLLDVTCQALAVLDESDRNLAKVLLLSAEAGVLRERISAARAFAGKDPFPARVSARKLRYETYALKEKDWEVRAKAAKVEAIRIVNELNCQPDKVNGTCLAKMKKVAALVKSNDSRDLFEALRLAKEAKRIAFPPPPKASAGVVFAAVPA